MANKSKKIRRTNRIRYKLKLKNNLRLSLFRSNNHIYAQLDDEKRLQLFLRHHRKKSVISKLLPKKLHLKLVN